MKVKRNNLLKFFGVIVILMFYIIADFQLPVLKYAVAVTLLAECIYATYKGRKNTSSFTMMIVITYELYSIIISRYLSTKLSDRIVSRYIENANEYYYGLAICIFFVWMAIFLHLISSVQEKPDNIIKAKDAEQANHFIGGLCAIAAIIVLLIGFDFSKLLTQSRGSVSSYFEYAIMFFILGYYYAGNAKKYRYALNAVLIVYCLLALLTGERIGVVQMVFAPFILYYGQKIPIKKVFLLILFGIFVMTMVGGYRTGWSTSKTLLKLWDGKLSFDGADHGFYTSMTMLFMSAKDSWGFRLSHGLQYILTIFTGNKSWLQHYTYRFYPHTYGGFAPYIAYYYFGWIGVFLTAVIVGVIIKKAYAIAYIKKGGTTGDYCGLLIVLIACTTFRWFAYDICILFREILIFTVLFLFFKAFDKRKMLSSREE